MHGKWGKYVMEDLDDPLLEGTEKAVHEKIDEKSRRPSINSEKQKIKLKLDEFLENMPDPYIPINELKEEIINFLNDRNLKPDDLALILESCIDEISYWSMNNARIVCKKNPESGRWRTQIINDGKVEITTESSNKVVSMVAATILFSKNQYKMNAIPGLKSDDLENEEDQ